MVARSHTDSRSTSPSQKPTTPDVSEEKDTYGARSWCIAPLDTRYGLPTACLDEHLDVGFDDQQGHIKLNSKPAFQALIAESDP